MKATEYDIQVSQICPESLFKIITNLSYFPNLKQDEQRSILFKMVGDISNETVSKGNKDFEEFLNMVSGKDFEVFKKEISTQKKKLKDELSSIPARIDELKRSFPDALDWDNLQKQLEVKQLELKSIEEGISDVSKQSEKTINID